MSPQIPGMPSPPPVDAGAGAHGSQPIYKRADDLAFFFVASKARVIADAAGWTHAASGMRHYLANTGTDYHLDPDELMNEVPGVKAHVDNLVSSAVGNIARDSANHGKNVTFDTGWEDYYVHQSENEDWFLAMAGVEVAVTGVVSTLTAADGGGQPNVIIDYKVHIYDRYNWDGTKETPILGINVTDKQLGELHTAGLAKEFNQFGSSEVLHYNGVLPESGPIKDLPTGRDNGGGTRVDPTR